MIHFEFGIHVISLNWYTKLVINNLNSLIKNKVIVYILLSKEIRQKTKILSKKLTFLKKNIIFKYDNGKKPINIFVDIDFTLRELLILFFSKINRLDLVENWGKKFTFIYNGHKLPPSKFIKKLKTSFITPF